MKDEIKIITLGDIFKNLETEEKAFKFKDYITNLQEENKRLKENAIHNDKVVDKARWNEMIYKSRIDRAVDGMQQLIDDVNTKTIISLNNFIPKLEEIQDKLAGGDDNE